MKILRLLIWFLFIGTINAQQNAAAVIRLFQQNKAVEWHLPVKGKSIPLMSAITLLLKKDFAPL